MTVGVDDGRAVGVVDARQSRTGHIEAHGLSREDGDIENEGQGSGQIQSGRIRQAAALKGPGSSVTFVARVPARYGVDLDRGRASVEMAVEGHNMNFDRGLDVEHVARLAIAPGEGRAERMHLGFGVQWGSHREAQGEDQP